MARSEARLSVDIWSDEEFRALSPMAQRMFMFLISQPDLTYVGVLPLRERRWAARAAGMSAEQVRADLAELADARFVVMDEDAEELLVRSFMRQDGVYRQPQLMRSAIDALALVSSMRLRTEIAQELRRISQLGGLHAASQEAVDTMLGQIGDPEPTPVAPAEDPARTLRAPSNDHGQGLTGKGVSNHLGLSSPNPDPPTPDPEKAPTEPSSRASRSKTQRGSRIPDDFTVTPAMVEWARSNVPQVDGRRETEKFINYWRAKSGKDATKLDWTATWRNWMLNAADRTPGGSRASPASGRTSGQNRHVDELPPDQREERNPFAGAVRSSQAGSEQ